MQKNACEDVSLLVSRKISGLARSEGDIGSLKRSGVRSCHLDKYDTYRGDSVNW